RLSPAKTSGRSPKVHSAIASAVSAIESRVTSGRRVRGSEMSSRVVRVDDAGQVQVYVLLDEYRPEHVAALAGLGLRVEIPLPDFRLVQGWLPSDAVDTVAALDFVRQIRPPGYRHNHVGGVTTEGDAIINGPAARSTFNVSGAGVKVGVMSDG